MPNTLMPERPTGELAEHLRRIRYVFTDLDGTMLGPGSTVLANAAGEPSLDLVETLVELRRADVEVIPCSGRNRSMLHEDIRVLGSTPSSARWVACSCSITTPARGSITRPICATIPRAAKLRMSALRRRVC